MVMLKTIISQNYKVFQLNYEILKATSVFDYYVFHAKGS